MQDSQNLFATTSTRACDSMKIQNNFSLSGIIRCATTLENNTQQSIYFKSLLPMKISVLTKYMTCLCLQITEIENREIPIEEINMNSLKTEPIENESYIFILKESTQQQNLKYQFKKLCILLFLILVKQLGFNPNIYRYATSLQDITFNLIKENQANYQGLNNFEITNHFDQFQNVLNYLKQKIEINFLLPKNTKCILYPKHTEQLLDSQVSLITKPSYINSQEKEIVVKISQIKKDHYDDHLRVIEILENLEKDINLQYFGYFQFFSLTVQFYKYYKQTFDQFQQKLRSDFTDIQLIQPIVKRALINIINQLMLLHDKYSIIHRDLKPQNIMIDLQNDSNEWQDYQDVKYVIIDFDCSIYTLNHKDQVFETYGGGTGYYIPPEREFNEYSKQYDVYQLGVIILETLFNIDQSVVNNCFWKRRDELMQAKCIFNINEDLQKSLVNMVAQLPKDRPCLKCIQQLLEEGL